MKKIEMREGIERDKLLAPLTTFQMGGKADYYCAVKDVEQIPGLVEICLEEGIPYVLLGWGSNVIFSDQGFRGLVIHNLARKMKLGEEVASRFVGKERAAGRLIEADAGTLLSQIIQFALKNGLTGMEKLMGVPGTIGGAVRGNAGAFGLEAKDLVEKALIYQEASAEEKARGNFQGNLREVDWDYFQFDYRHSRIKETREIVLKVWLRLYPGDTLAGVEEVRKIIASRAGKHPAGKSAGSFFKNPSPNSVGEGLSAGYVSDQCGFKGFHLGGAFISEKHGNFLMNDGQATLNEVYELCQRIQQAGFEKFGVKLAREVALIDEKGYIEDNFQPKQI